MKKNLAEIFGQRLWSMHADHVHALESRAEAIGALIAGGLTPAQKPEVAYNGGSTIVAEIAGDTATLEVCGDLIARAPWFAKAYLGAVDPLDVADALDALAADGNVKRVIIEADTCGGTVAGAQECAEAMARLRAAGKDVEVRVVGSLLSAGFWALGGATRIVATSTSLLGAIGVIYCVTDYSRMMESAGVDREYIANVPGKAVTHGRLTDESRAEFKRMATASAAVFHETLTKARGFNPAQLAAAATGQCWIAADAKRLGLIDVVGSAAEPADKPAGGAPAPEPVAPVLETSDDATPSASAGSPAASDSTTTPAAAGSDQDTHMLKTETLAALIAAHPAHAAMIAAEAIKPEASEAGITAAIASAEGKAKDQAIADLTAKAKAADERAVAAEAAKVKADADLAALKAHTPAHVDPGAGDPKAKAKTQVELEQLDLKGKADFFARGGQVVG